MRRDELDAVRDALGAEIAGLRAELLALQGEVARRNDSGAGVRAGHDGG